MIMDSLDTMLSDAVSISALLSYDTKYIKFRQLKKQMSNISTPSPAASPEPQNQSDIISMESVIDNSVLNEIEDTEQQCENDNIETPVTIGSEFFPSSVSSPSDSIPAIVSSSSELTNLAPVGEHFNFKQTRSRYFLLKHI